ncbi:cysteine-tryptophan domain-containing zinc finger protein 3 isoform X1 [Cryptomeria japonica]|uniref:cysteine-tryptophan domain-containing zinc finger protein 3 isoform X1 n=1 Tax=Cryptomeria japonica TaxID=3369 RepID=UPI0027DA712E|nr:cysteine-tryptophan domain-containing zinc finger protein 3 isoform X1 [Cryptomeria japonica]XP_057822181.2 cysteine-tryptophan domain-containing zinc finger protein 3 isoform X1 [Cryptomeria japonica]
MMEGVTLSQQHNYQQQRRKYSNGRNNADQIDINSQRQQEQEDLAEDVNDIELGRAFDLNTLERRLSDCFGPLRNLFKGQYYCENQGPKFGNYGSFLPIREHNPQTPKEQNSSGQVHSYSSQPTASERAVEKSARLVITDGPRRRGSIACRNPSLNDNTLHGFTEENLALNDVKFDGILSVEKMTSNGVKLRFKFGSDIISHQKNTAISTGLGLKNSSSTSPEETLNKGQMVATGVDSPPDMSPLSIIQIMTSFEVPGGSLLSPLPKILMEGQGKEDLSSKVIKRTSGKSQVTEACLANSIGFECGKGIQAPIPKKDTTASIFESKKEQYSEFRGDKVKKVKTDTGTKFRVSKASDVLVSKDSSKLSMKELHQRKPEMGIAHDVETDIHRVRSLIPKEPNNLGNGKDFSACPSKIGSLETAAAKHPSMLSKTGKGSLSGGVKESHKIQREGQAIETRKENGHKDVANVRKINKSLKEVNKVGLSGANTYKEKNVLDDENKGVPKEMVLRRVDTHEKVVVNMEHVKDMDMENKKTNGINIYKKSMKEESKVVTKSKLKESLTEKSCASKGQKEQSKNNSKDLHGNSAKCTDEQFVCKKEINMAHCKESIKQARYKHFDREISNGIERGKRRDVANEHDLKKLELVSTIKAHVLKVDTQLLPQQSATQDPATNTSDFDDWVFCDACGKWRLRPIGLKISPLPKYWLCDMMFWLPGMNHCDVPEEETTKAVRDQNAISQTQILTETSQGMDTLPASVSTVILDPKSSNQFWPRSLQSSTKIGSNKKGVVQRSMPNVSGAVKFSDSFAGKDEHFPVKNKSDQYDRHMEREEGAVGFSHCEVGGKSNGVIKQKNKDKVKLKETSGGEACETEVGLTHTSNVKRKMDSELKKCKSAKKMKAKNNLVHDAKGVDSLPLKSKRTDHGFKIATNDELTKENGVESMNGVKFKDQQQVTKKRKFMERKEGKATHQGVLETNCMVDCEVGEEEGQPEPKRVKALKTGSIQPHASKGNKDEQEQKMKNVSSNVECMLHEIAEHSNQHSKEHGLMKMVSDHSEPLKKESSCWPPFLSSTSSSSKFSCYTKSLGTVPERQGSPLECSVSSLPVRDVKAEKPSLGRCRNARKGDLIDSCNLRFSSPKGGIIGDALSDDSGFIMCTKDPCKPLGTNEKSRVYKSTSNNSGGKDSKQFTSTKPRDSFVRKYKQGTFSSKDRMPRSCYLPEKERDSLCSLEERKAMAETDSIKDKSDTSTHSANRSEGRGDDSSVDIFLYKGNRVEGSLIGASSGESSIVRKQSDTSQKGTLCSQLKSPMWKGFIERDIERALVSSNREHQSRMANAALEEGRDLEQKADRLKSNGGDELEVIGFYFRASLKFLQSASILEPLSAGSVRHQENKSMALFTYSASLSEDCAKVYERNGNWAAATLAYQCTGVAHMHVVMAKTLSISRERQELKSAAVLVPTGESPRSSASDVDNLNSHALAVVNQEKGLASLHASGNYVIDTQHCQQYNRLLQFVDDTNAALAAFAKANCALAAASDSSYREHEISVVKKAVNLNFHNLDGLLNLAIPVMESASLC